MDLPEPRRFCYIPIPQWLVIFETGKGPGGKPFGVYGKVNVEVFINQGIVRGVYSPGRRD